MKYLLAALLIATATMCQAQEEPDEGDQVFNAHDWVVETSEKLEIYADQGGKILLYEDRIWANRQQIVEIRGTCISSCTMFLGSPNVCIGAAAVFGFHGPSTSSISPGRMTNLIMRISALYPEELRVPFQTNWGLSTDMTWFTGQQVRAMVPGLALCL